LSKHVPAWLPVVVVIIGSMSVPRSFLMTRSTWVQEVVVSLGAIVVPMSDVVACGPVEVAPSRVMTCPGQRCPGSTGAGSEWTL